MASVAVITNLSTARLTSAWPRRSQHVRLSGFRHVSRRVSLPKYQRQGVQIACTAQPRRQDTQLAARKVCCGFWPLDVEALSWTGHFADKAALQVSQSDPTPFFEPLLRSFVLGLGTGAIFEATHVSWKVCPYKFSTRPVVLAERRGLRLRKTHRLQCAQTLL